MEENRRILLVTFPEQGHINPSLEFAKRLVKMGVEVTFVTTSFALNRMAKRAPTLRGLKMVGFFEGQDKRWTEVDDLEQFMAELRRCGSEAIKLLITSSIEKGQPFDHVVYTIFLPWVGQLAHNLHVPSTFLWIQPATIFAVYYHFFNGYGDAMRNIACSDYIELPGLPPLAAPDLPLFLQASNCYNFVLPLMKEHLEIVELETNPKVLVNTFNALEAEALRATEKLNLVGVGPLIPSAFTDGKDPSDTSFGGDLFQNSSDYIEWLNSKPPGSIVYVSFGTMSVLSKQQIDEIASGLQESHRPFLWVIRASSEGDKEEQLKFTEKLEKRGMIVPWCSQLEVLSHPSVGCFVTHCGWNSSLESLVSGIPVVAFPQWTDQTTNAKLIEDVWKTGVRVVKNKEGIVEGNEIRKCIDIVMGGEGRGEEMRRNAQKWKRLAREAAKEGGSSDLNLNNFLRRVKAV
ncbi:unnamed protein product [Thlaspi arvense]|uniref:Glycosyltransferase n=1 Tax=Thlaspi arvense TaxID=13288 RepID=A0AAU9RM16_THLAR|nr:unnamed protein product [Thlaspi arvense]